MYKKKKEKRIDMTGDTDITAYTNKNIHKKYTIITLYF